MPWSLNYDSEIKNQLPLTLKSGKQSYDLQSGEVQLLKPGRHELHLASAVIYFRVARSDELIVDLASSVVPNYDHFVRVSLGGIEIPIQVLPRYGFSNLIVDSKLPHRPWHLDFIIDIDDLEHDSISSHFIFFEYLTPHQVQLRGLQG